MIKSLLADEPHTDMLSLENILAKEFKDIDICGKANSLSTITNLVKKIDPELIFINIKLLLSEGIVLNKYFSNPKYEIIFLADSSKSIVEAIKCNACGYLLKPVKEKNMKITVRNALSTIYKKKEYERNKIIADKYFRQSSNEDVIGVPTIEGFEFITIKEIIRCEGLQKCTRVITKEKTDIISSYNLGEFRKLLEPYGFYSPHKSHLINLHHMRKYHKEGNILMTNHSYVPVAKRKKREFLDHVKHI